MQRRQFLKYNALTAISFTALFANTSHHGTHSMQQTHGNSHNEHMTHNIDTSFITLEDESLALLHADYLPQQEFLKPLVLLTNQSKKKGEFKATIEIKEAEVTIIKNKKTRCYVYSDATTQANSFLAPKIEVFEGDKVYIKVKNNLKEPTTIHWHGLPVPPSQDGNPMDAIPANGYRIYEFHLPKNCAGTYWYHPHSLHTTAKQVYRGLAGAFVVKSHNNPLIHFMESDWFITDLRLDSKAQIPANTLSDWLDGREGQFVLINGQYKPQIKLDSMQKIRIYNACSARYLNLEIDGATFLLLGTDGGLLEQPIEQKRLFLSPASRVEVVIKNTKKGHFKLISHFYDRNKMIPKDEPKVLELADLILDSLLQLDKLPKILRTLPLLQNPQRNIAITMSEDHQKMHVFHQKDKDLIRTNLASMFFINGKTFTIKHIDLHVKPNEVHDIIVTNKSHMDHPFHIHGTQFELIERQFKGKLIKPQFRALQDTINVRPDESVRLRMRQDFIGMRMFHCHILEHEDLGMMGSLMVK